LIPLGSKFDPPKSERVLGFVYSGLVKMDGSLVAGTGWLLTLGVFNSQKTSTIRNQEKI
jgi:hypothetical protein